MTVKQQVCMSTHAHSLCPGPDSGEEACQHGLAGVALCFVNRALLKGS